NRTVAPICSISGLKFTPLAIQFMDNRHHWPRPTSSSRNRAAIFGMTGSVADTFPSFDGHHRCGQECNQLLLAAVLREHVGLSETQGATGFHDAASGDNAIADGWRDEI